MRSLPSTPTPHGHYAQCASPTPPYQSILSLLFSCRTFLALDLRGITALHHSKSRTHQSLVNPMNSAAPFQLLTAHHLRHIYGLIPSYRTFQQPTRSLPTLFFFFKPPRLLHHSTSGDGDWTTIASIRLHLFTSLVTSTFIVPRQSPCRQA